ncbi:MAG: hypothetical protein AAF802_03730 [Planctomycetota bacterium]
MSRRNLALELRPTVERSSRVPKTAANFSLYLGKRENALQSAHPEQSEVMVFRQQQTIVHP